MADFRTHITTSSVLGAVYGLAGHVHWGLPTATCAVAAGMCGVAGMLPDVDSDSGHTQRELMTFLASVTPMLLLDRFSQLGLTHEEMMLAGGCVYIVVRFGLGELLRRYTVHRGMWHSVPAAITVAMLAFLLCGDAILEVRLFKVGAVLLGFLIHLLLDEVWAVEFYRGSLRLKNSFGTAFKLFSRSWWANISTYGKLLMVTAVVYSDPMVMERLPTNGPGRVQTQEPHDKLPVPSPQARRERNQYEPFNR